MAASGRPSSWCASSYELAYDRFLRFVYVYSIVAASGGPPPWCTKPYELAYDRLLRFV